MSKPTKSDTALSKFPASSSLSLKIEKSLSNALSRLSLIKFRLLAKIKLSWVSLFFLSRIFLTDWKSLGLESWKFESEPTKLIKSSALLMSKISSPKLFWVR